MKKMIFSGLAVLATATSAFGGALVFDEPVEAEVIVEEDPVVMGSSGAWLIPLLAIAAVALIASNSSGSGGSNGGGNRPPPKGNLN